MRAPPELQYVYTDTLFMACRRREWCDYFQSLSIFFFLYSFLYLLFRDDNVWSPLKLFDLCLFFQTYFPQTSLLMPKTTIFNISNGLLVARAEYSLVSLHRKEHC